MSATGRKLSSKQQRILDFLKAFIDRHGYPPSVRDIAHSLGISSTSVVDYNLKVLEKQGCIRRTREVSRGIELLTEQGGPGSGIVEVPIVGLIAAGEPIEALASDFDQVEMSSSAVPEGAYALRVKGKSMIEDLIDDGDLVIIKPQSNADNGDIVVALLPDSPMGEGQATLKRLYVEKEMVRLQPANATMQPIFVNPDDLRIQGKVVAVIRQLT